ncbi:MAG: hypothetical protein ACLFQV_02085 [Vulcanimicrobiota bacterium]
MPICPFSHDYRQCYPECALYVEAVNKCSFYVSSMLLEDLQKVAVVSYENLIRNEEEFLKRTASPENKPE